MIRPPCFRAICFSILAVLLGSVRFARGPVPWGAGACYSLWRSYGAGVDPHARRVRLAATRTCGCAKPKEKFPPMLEYLPYRKGRLYGRARLSDSRYFARRGYVSVAVDIRGFGPVKACRPTAKVF